MRTILIMVAAMGLLATGYAQDADTTTKLSGSALINKYIQAKWEEAGLKPVKKCDEAEFMRRAYLDIIGVIPSLEECEKYLADRAPNKRQKLVETLLKDEHYGEHWGDVWSGILVGFDNERRDQQARSEETHDLKVLFSKNTPFDEFARQVITVSGAVYERYNAQMKAEEIKDLPKEVPLASYIARQSRVAGKDFALAMAGKITRVFMGVQIQCAQCHDHPFDKWTQEEFYGMASFFTGLIARQQTYTPPEDKGKDKNAVKKDQIRYYVVGERDELAKEGARPGGKGMMMMKDGMDLSIPNGKGGPIKAAFLDSGKGVEADQHRRATFAKYVTEPSNLQFAKEAVNRYWAHFFGVGIVNPVDDFNGRNKPTHPDLIKELAQDFIDHKYNLHWLITAITGSEAYSLSSRAAGKERDLQAEKFLALARVRPLTPEQIMHSTVEAVGISAPGLGRRPMGPGAKVPPPPGAPPGGENMKERVMAQYVNQFRYSFGDDEGGEVGEFAGTIPSALLMMNSNIIGSGTNAMNRGNHFSEILAKHKSEGDRIRAIFLTVLSRTPTSSEASRWTAHIGRAGGDKGYEDLIWTLLNTSEFLFNH
jgi:hypothetical protein